MRPHHVSFANEAHVCRARCKGHYTHGPLVPTRCGDVGGVCSHRNLSPTHYHVRKTISHTTCSWCICVCVCCASVCVPVCVFMCVYVCICVYVCVLRIFGEGEGERERGGGGVVKGSGEGNTGGGRGKGRVRGGGGGEGTKRCMRVYMHMHLSMYTRVGMCVNTCTCV